MLGSYLLVFLLDFKYFLSYTLCKPQETLLNYKKSSITVTFVDFVI